MSLQTRLAALITAIGADIKNINTQLSTLLTTAYPWLEEVRSSAYTNSTVNASDVFTGFKPNANTRYIVDVFASVFTAAITTGIQVGLTGPTSGITASAVKIITANTSAADTISHTALNNFQTMTAGLTTPTLLSLQALVEVGASPGIGNIRLQAKSEVAGSLVTIRPGSSMRWREI